MVRFQCYLVSFLLLSAFSVNPAFASDSVVIDASGLNMGIGYRSDQLDWSISGGNDAENPTFFSELSWEDLQILQFQTAGWLELNGLPFVESNSLILVDLSFGKILNGNVQDSDYADYDRNNEWSRSFNDASEGLTCDLSGAFGPIFKLSNVAGISITPLVGYGFSMQALTMTEGYQVISEPELLPTNASSLPDIGAFPGLDSSYTAYWFGPWLGINTDYKVNGKLKLSIGVEYHWVEYFAQADWNLRTKFIHPVSFEHETTGTGIVWDLQGQYQLNKKWSWLFSGNIQSWETESGSDRTFFTDGTVGLSQLNQVSWDSYALTSGLQYRF